MTLPATPESVRTARQFVAERVRSCPVDVAAAAVLLTSELATNCVVHGRTEFELRVQTDEGRVRVEVADAEPDPPRQSTGNGLRLVDGLATRWGADLDVDGHGKVVWFEL